MTFDNCLVELPGFAQKLRDSVNYRFHRGEIQRVEAPHQSASSREPTEVGTRLEYASWLARPDGPCGAVVEGGESSGTVHQRTVSTTGHSDSNPRYHAAAIYNTCQVSSYIYPHNVGSLKYGS
jgi:hypothetical protein